MNCCTIGFFDCWNVSGVPSSTMPPDQVLALPAPRPGHSGRIPRSQSGDFAPGRARQKLDLDDDPDLVIIQVYITNAYRAYPIADHYRARGAYVALAACTYLAARRTGAACGHDFLGPGEHTSPRSCKTSRPARRNGLRIVGTDAERLPPIRRDLIQRHRYSYRIRSSVSRGCPHHCTFCTRTASRRRAHVLHAESSTTRSPRSPAFPADISTSSTIISSAIRSSRAISSAACGAWAAFFRARRPRFDLRDDSSRSRGGGTAQPVRRIRDAVDASLAGAGKRQNLNRSYRDVVRRLTSAS